MNKATFVKRVNGAGDGRVYRLDPPLNGVDYVWVSATSTYSGPETYIFASDADGAVLDWGELPGSFRGGLDHAEALRGAGYEVVS